MPKIRLCHASLHTWRHYSTLQLRLPRACVRTHDQVTMMVEDGSFSVDTVPEVASYVCTIDTEINDS